jgi:hypothetical protein
MTSNYIKYTNSATSIASTGTLTGATDVPSAAVLCTEDKSCLAFDSTFKNYQFVEAPASFTTQTGKDLYIKAGIDFNNLQLPLSSTYTYPPAFPVAATGGVNNLQNNNKYQIWNGSWVLWKRGGNYIGVNSGGLTWFVGRENAIPFYLTLYIFQQSGPSVWAQLQAVNIVNGVPRLVNVWANYDFFNKLQVDWTNEGRPPYPFEWNVDDGDQTHGVTFSNATGGDDGGMYGYAGDTQLEMIVQSTNLRNSDFMNSSQYPIACCSNTISNTGIASTCSSKGFAPGSNNCLNVLNSYCLGSNLLTVACQNYCATDGVNCDTQQYSYCDSKNNANSYQTNECACFLNNAFYENYLSSLRLQLPGVSQAIASTIPACFYAPCANSSQKPFLYRSGQETCPNNTVAICVTNQTVNANGSIQGNVTLGQNVGCNALSSTGTSTSTGTGTNTGTGTGTSSDNSMIFIIVGVIVGVFFVVICIYLFTRSKKPSVPNLAPTQRGSTVHSNNTRI